MTASPEPTVFVVDDDEDVRNALCWLIESVALNVETFESAERFLEVYDGRRPGCLVLDLRMPGMGGLGLLESLSSRKIHLPVIMLTGHGDVPVAVRAMKAGAMEFVEKPFADQDLLDKIQKALQEDAGRRRVLGEHTLVKSRLDDLTPRELEILERVVKGQANKVISADLGISERTVETHRKNVMEKMQAKSLAELVEMAVLHYKHPEHP
jgi:FixJ family two-component response regulator